MSTAARTGLRQHGFSYLEIMVAVVVLAICAVPLAEAIRNGIRATTVGTDKARELRCMKNQMETVLAEPYQNLWNAARGKDIASSYSRPADAACVARNVYIARYEHEHDRSPVFLADSASAGRLESALLYITVSSPDTGYAFTTLVAR